MNSKLKSLDIKLEKNCTNFILSQVLNFMQNEVQTNMQKLY